MDVPVKDTCLPRENHFGCHIRLIHAKFCDCHCMPYNAPFTFFAGCIDP